jgi:hypothetical protein
MALTAVRPYFRNLLNDLNYREWEDGFNVDNIPNTVLNRSYYVGPPSVSRRRQDQGDLEVDVLVQIEVIFKGYRNPRTGIDNAVEACQEILLQACNARNRLTAAIKDVQFQNMALEPLNAANDNHIRMRLDFMCIVIVPTT